MTLLFCFASIQLRPIADYDMLTVGRSARDLLEEGVVNSGKGVHSRRP